MKPEQLSLWPGIAEDVVASKRARWAAYIRDWFARNPGYNAKMCAAGYQRHRKKRDKKNREWMVANPWYAAAWQAGNRARRRSAMPSWVDTSFMKIIYECCPDGHHVDHIVPLKGANVCGLHVPHNLQYLPAFENISKGNKLMEKYL